MTLETLKACLLRRPFEPMRVKISNGAEFEIRHPEMASLAKTAMVIVHADADGSPTDKVEYISLSAHRQRRDLGRRGFTVMMVLRRLTILSLIHASAVGTGCATVHEIHLPDPDARSFVRITNMSGRTFFLEDGRAFDLAGVRFNDLTPAQQLEFEKIFGSIVLTPKSQQPSALVFPQREGRLARVEVSTSMYLMPGPPQEAYLLFPRYVELKPYREDVGEHLIWLGLARANPDELDDPTRKSGYESAEQNGKPRPTSASPP